MQIFSTPHTSVDMQCSLTMTGITVLKEGRYRSRHGGMKSLQQDGNTTISKKQPLPKPKKRKKNIPPVKPPFKKLRYYRINKKEVTHRIKGYVNQMPGEKMMYFWTITFPVNTPDTECISLLNRWLTRLRQEKMLKSYLWIAERQHNGTLHFHMVVHNKMDVRKANKFMRASIMHSINEGAITWSRAAATKYNGIDIAKNRKTKKVTNFAKQKAQRSLSNYLTKYVTKNDTEFTHLAWHCSRDYSNLIIAIHFSIPELRISNTRFFIDPHPVFETKFYTFYKWKDDTPKELLTYLSKINQHILQLLN